MDTEPTPFQEEESDLLQQIQFSQKLIQNALLENVSLQQQLIELHQIHSSSQKEYEQLVQEYSLFKKKNQEETQQYQSSLSALQTTISMLQQRSSSSSSSSILMAPNQIIEPCFSIKPLTYFYFLFAFAFLALLDSYT